MLPECNWGANLISKLCTPVASASSHISRVTLVTALGSIFSLITGASDFVITSLLSFLPISDNSFCVGEKKRPYKI